MNKIEINMIKPSKYNQVISKDAPVDRYEKGFFPNPTNAYINALLSSLDSEKKDKIASVNMFDEYVETDLNYLRKLCSPKTENSILMLTGVQSHQFQRACDLGAYAKYRGTKHVIIGGPHVMACDTSMLHGRGISFALSEAEVILTEIIQDALWGELKPLYGTSRLLSNDLDLKAGIIAPPSVGELDKYAFKMRGIHPAKGCKMRCNFCLVYKINGGFVRGQDIQLTIENLRLAMQAGAKYLMYTSDNFNDYPDAVELLNRMIEENIRIPFFVQCTTEIKEEFVELLARAGCFQIFFGVETFRKDILNSIRKAFNRSANYENIISWCNKYGIISHFSNIIGFPQHDANAIKDHVKVTLKLGPTVVSVYILTPIPGTDQYQEFLDAGLIKQKNMDYFDGTNLVFYHDKMSGEELRELLFWSYRKIMNPIRTFGRALKISRKGTFGEYLRDFAFCPFYASFAYFQACRGQHPMSGGFGRVILDNVGDYLPYRRKMFGDILKNDLLPLPNNLVRPEFVALKSKNAKV